MTNNDKFLESLELFNKIGEKEFLKRYRKNHTFTYGAAMVLFKRGVCKACGKNTKKLSGTPSGKGFSGLCPECYGNRLLKSKERSLNLTERYKEHKKEHNICIKCGSKKEKDKHIICANCRDQMAITARKMYIPINTEKTISKYEVGRIFNNGRSPSNSPIKLNKVDAEIIKLEKKGNDMYPTLTLAGGYIVRFLEDQEVRNGIRYVIEPITKKSGSKKRS